MATAYVAARGTASAPVYKGAGAGELCTQWGTFATGATALVVNDTINFCRIPAGARVIDGLLIGSDIDTGTGVFEFDVGYPANGVESAAPQGFLDSGALNGTAIVNYYNVSGFRIPFNKIAVAGPILVSRETIVQGLVTVAPNAGGTGQLTVVVHYLCE